MHREIFVVTAALAALCVHCAPGVRAARGGEGGASGPPRGAEPGPVASGAAPSVPPAAPASPVGAAETSSAVPPEAPANVPSPSTRVPSIPALEQEFIDHINRERTSRGLGPLEPDVRLTAAARAHSREMSELGYFDHRSPTAGLEMPMDRFLRAVADGGGKITTDLLLGENIYHVSEYNHYFNVAFGHRAIMNSPSHRAAILEPRYIKVGVGAYQDARGELWTTQMFLRDAP